MTHFLGVAMRVFLVALVGLVGCTIGDTHILGGAPSPVFNCDEDPSVSDCCTKDRHCTDFYGADFPFCSRPERPGGGMCGECLTNGNCPGAQVCFENAVGLRQCLDMTKCWETPEGAAVGDCR